MSDSFVANIGVDPYSLGTLKLTMFRGDMELSIGSGFLWKYANQNVLVTAWHCVTGTHPVTGKSLSKTGARPDRIEANVASKTAGLSLKLIIPLYDEDRADWFVHSLGSKAVDIAAMRMPTIDSTLTDAKPLSDLSTSKMRMSVGDDVFIIGYPRGLERHGLPIWKRGSVAIDPAAAIDVDEHRTLLIDSATREGLSGGPVIMRSVGQIRQINGPTLMDGRTHTMIVGLYSGRIGSADNFEAQVGMVWPIRYVEEIMMSGVRDTFLLDG